jgi:hypothetical protein
MIKFIYSLKKTFFDGLLLRLLTIISDKSAKLFTPFEPKF